MFAYLEPYGELNGHLDKKTERQFPNNVVSNPKFTRDYVVERNPPCILANREECKEKLQSTFDFSDTLFNKHAVYFNNHYLEALHLTENAGKNSPENMFIAANIKWNHGFYHFMTEALPMILFVNKMTNEKYDILSCHAGFIEPVLRYFGVNNRVFYSAETFDQPKYMAVRMPTIECGNPSLEKIQLIREVICQKTVFMPKVGILVFRKENVRRIHNFEEVFEMLQRVYPHIVWHIFDSLPIADAVMLFSRAKIIVGAHGAGLTNMLFSPTGTTVVEFADLENPNICYWHLAEMLKNRHLIIPCPTIDNQFTINIEEVEPIFSNEIVV